MTSLAVVPSPALTAAPLYVIEDWLAALVETAELVPPEQEEEFRAELALAMKTGVEKRDRVGQYFAHLDTQIAFADSEIRRLHERKAFYENIRERLGRYVVTIIEGLGLDAKGKYQKLEGRFVTFSLRKCPNSVDVTNESAVPSEYKILTLKLPASVWEQILDSLELEQRAIVIEQAKATSCEPSKTLIKAALEAKLEVPGAGLVTDRHSLKRS